MFDALPPLPPDTPVYMQEAVACAIEIAPKYGVPANVVMAVAEVEGAPPQTIRVNQNGSFDVGRMQINSVHFDMLSAYGITPQHLMASDCYPVELATWMIARHMQGCPHDLWTCVARYHSKTPPNNLVYRQKLLPAAMRWASWIQQYYPVIKVRP